MLRRRPRFIGEHTPSAPPLDVIDVSEPDKPKWSMRGCVCATAIFSIILAAVALGFAIAAYAYYSHVTGYAATLVSGPIGPSPCNFYLDGTAAPQAMVLPNDLAAYVGQCHEIGIYSRSAEAHTVTIALGALPTTWDGVNRVATFGGAKGDGFSFKVLQNNLVTVTSTRNVGFS